MTKRAAKAPAPQPGGLNDHASDQREQARRAREEEERLEAKGLLQRDVYIEDPGGPKPDG